MCSVSLMLSITNDMFLEKKTLILFVDIELILDISGSSFTMSVKVMEQERSVDDELPAEDR